MADHPRRLRPPAVPLVTLDPYTSCWSMADRLTEDWSRHWTGMPFPLFGALRVDGRPFRFMGGPEWTVPKADQLDLVVGTTRTRYRFGCGPVQLDLAFTTPLLLDDLEILGRPAAYVDLTVSSLDGQAHRVEAYLDLTGAWAVNLPHEKVTWSRTRGDGLTILSMRSISQDVLGKAGDHLRIDWGTLFLAVPEGRGEALVGDIDFCRDGFLADGVLTDAGLLPMPRKTSYWGEAVLAARFALDCSAGGPAHAFAIIAYDDEYSAEYFGTRLRPWWRRNGAGPTELLRAALAEHDALIERCRTFDRAVVDAARQVGGEPYAELLGLVYRQAVSAHKLCAGPEGQPFFFSKENFSNACMATVDVTFPSCPVFLLYGPDVLEAMLDPVVEYAASERWPFPFPPHDIGTYPLGNGQVYRNFHRPESTDPMDWQMPVEEAGNLLIMAGATGRRKGSCDVAARHWPLFRQWAEYLVEHGLEPAGQLCTDDFGGMVANNANLAAKAVVGLAAFADLAERQGEAGDAARFGAIARNYAVAWRSRADDGDHTRLAYDQPGTWSLKYNLAFDRVLGLGVCPDAFYARELAFYESKRGAFGIPLDGRGPAAKPEWQLWVAAMSDDPEQRRRFIDDVWRYVDGTPSRVPVSDFYLVDSGRQRGWQARSVVGGFFMPLLAQAMRST